MSENANNIVFYQTENADVVVNVVYRVNSKKATKFRQWATKTLQINSKNITFRLLTPRFPSPA